MRIVYTLSNRQRKELFVRSRPLDLALPAPPLDELPDPAAWARSVLPPDVAALVRSAEETEVLVAPQPADTAPATLNDLLGEIREAGGTGGRWCVWVAVVAVRLAPAHLRHAVAGPLLGGEPAGER